LIAPFWNASCKTYLSQNEARAEVFDYIKFFYNPGHRRLILGYESYGLGAGSTLRLKVAQACLVQLAAFWTAAK
jgi:hypothetical protein